MKRRVVITGMGIVSPLGNDLITNWESIKESKCGIDFIKAFDTSNSKIKLAAEVKNLDFLESFTKQEARKLDRFTKFAVIASDEAIKMSGLNLADFEPDEVGVMVSSGIGGIGTISEQQMRGVEKSFDMLSPFFIPMAITNMAAGTIAIRHKIQGICTCVVTACAGSTNAIGDAFHYIRDGYATVMVTGGAEATITPLGIGGFSSLKALSESVDPLRASIPFDKERNGFVMGEGAGILVLEEYQNAVNRGANILAEIVGYGSTCDAYHMTAPEPNAGGATRAILRALKDGGVEKEMIDYVNCHGTSTTLNDRAETISLKAAFEDHAKNLMISSTKSMTGHLLGAAGAVEAIYTAMALKDGFIPATINYQVKDEELDLDVVPNVGRKKEITYAISNSLGFGGHNASIILKKV